MLQKFDWKVFLKLELEKNGKTLNISHPVIVYDANYMVELFNILSTTPTVLAPRIIVFM